MEKEQWNYDKFISFYNKIAMNTGGWKYEQRTSKEDLKEQYEQSSEQTIEKFAEGIYIYEQKT